MAENDAPPGRNAPHSDTNYSRSRDGILACIDRSARKTNAIWGVYVRPKNEFVTWFDLDLKFDVLEQQ